MDTFGCMYKNQFDRTAPQSNLLTYDDQSGGKDQFAITTIMNRGTVYYLAASTMREDRLGLFKVSVSGPAKASIRLVKSKLTISSQEHVMWNKTPTNILL